MSNLENHIFVIEKKILKYYRSFWISPKTGLNEPVYGTVELYYDDNRKLDCRIPHTEDIDDMSDDQYTALCLAVEKFNDTYWPGRKMCVPKRMLPAQRIAAERKYFRSFKD